MLRGGGAGAALWLTAPVGRGCGPLTRDDDPDGGTGRRRNSIGRQAPGNSASAPMGLRISASRKACQALLSLAAKSLCVSS